MRVPGVDTTEIRGSLRSRGRSPAVGASIRSTSPASKAAVRAPGVAMIFVTTRSQSGRGPNQCGLRSSSNPVPAA